MLGATRVALSIHLEDVSVGVASRPTRKRRKMDRRIIGRSVIDTESKMDEETKSEVFLKNISDDDCGVIAFQAITGMSRKRSIQALKRAYVEGVGTFRSALMLALADRGYEFEEKEVMPGEHTLALFASTYDNGVFMLWVEGHVCILRDGDTLNFSDWNDVLEHVDIVRKAR